MAKKQSRLWIMSGLTLALVAVFSYSFWPRPYKVDIGEVERLAMVVTIDEEAKTRVRDAYVVSAPIAGRMRRLGVEPGDRVVGGETVIVQMLPLNPSALDVRTREQARASVSAAVAALRVARADLNKALADRDLAEQDYRRVQALFAKGSVAEASLERGQQAARVARAAYDTAMAAISMREAELANARARLISFSQPAPASQAPPADGGPLPLLAPVSGRVLRLMQESETTLAAGTPILEIGDISKDLEVVAELLSTDAVKVAPGQRVIIEKWGRERALQGVVERVEPWGFSKYSALGVEEQRVNAIIKFTDPIERRQSLGHGYRVEVRIVVWESAAALALPVSALLRSNGGWAVYAVVDGRAQLKPVELGQRNSRYAEVISGVAAGDAIVLYPGPGLAAGMAVVPRRIEKGA
ncbi:MAG: HlyD family efflux transporter periplasmic adaptor subunit [Cellvibrionaceae bacterium]|nr:HlyD family efflux transporter periplasmic adaptor subunit [Cellvibrionaceae bacterium]